MVVLVLSWRVCMSRRSTPRALRRAAEQMESAAGYLPSAVREGAAPSVSSGASVLGAWVAARGPKSTYTAAYAREICERHVNGESIASICRDPRLPNLPTLYSWLRRQPEFAAAYAVARTEHDEIYGTKGGYSPYVADEVCRRVRAGETLTQLSADPGMPTYETILEWRKAFPEFQAAYLAAREASAEACEHNALREAELAYDRDSAAVAKVRSEMWKWAAAVRNPKTHGTRVEATVSVEIGLADRLNAAIGRVTGRVIEGVAAEVGPGAGMGADMGVGMGVGMGLAAPGEAQEGGVGASEGSGAG